jgi:hypothetical protein
MEASQFLVLRFKSLDVFQETIMGNGTVFINGEQFKHLSWRGETTSYKKKQERNKMV